MTDQGKAPAPALTPAEWDMHIVWRKRHMIDATNSGPLNIRWNAGGGTPGRHFQELEPPERHAFAALCLYGQDFGFTQEEADHLDGMRQRVYGHDEVLYSIVQKIRALLPPQP